MSWLSKKWKRFKKSVKGLFSAAGDVISSAFDGLMSLFGLDDLLEDFEGTLITKTGAVQLLPVVYGERTVGGVWVFTEVTGSDNAFLWRVFVLCDADSPIEAIPSIFVDDVLHDDAKYSSLVLVETTLGTHTTQPFTQLESDSDGKWTSSHLLLGVAAVAIRTKWDQKVWSGLPRVTFRVKGSKVLDVTALPTETRIYSVNPADILFDYLTNPIYGKGLSIVDGVDIDIASFISARSYCNDSITSFSGGPSHVRMECNMVLQSGVKIMDNIRNILKSCRGALPYINGLFYLIIERHYTPSDYGLANYFDFNTDNIIGSWGFSSGDVNSRYNRIKATFPNEDLEHKPDEIIVESSTFRTEDQRLLEKTISISGTSNVYRAIDTASVFMRRSRQQIQVSFMATTEALQVRAGTIVTITHPTPGWSLKQFRVAKIKLLATGNCRVNLTEHESSVYDLTLPNEANTSLDTNLPDPSFVPDITNVVPTSDESVLKLGLDGTLIIQLYLTWDIPDNIFVNGYDIEYKLNADSIWLSGGSPNSIGTNEIYIQNVIESSSYDFQVRARNSGGFVGEWNTTLAHVIIGKTSNPADVTGFINSIVKSGVELSWASNTDLDIFDYEIRSEGSDWDTANFVGRTDGTKFPVGVLPTGSATYRIKARDTGKRLSDNSVSTVAVITDPVAPLVSHVIDDDDVVLTWVKPTSAFTVVAYALSYTHPIDGLKQLGVVDTTTLRFKVDWGGTATFHVAALDLAGNLGSEGDEIVVISAPKAGLVTVSVIDNNVLLNWPNMANTLPIKEYELRKGATYGASTFIAFQEGTFAALFENSAGTFTYWVTGKDTAGNLGVNNSITAEVSEPPDFVLHDDQNIALSTGVKTNVFLNQDNFLLFGVNLTETWTDHFNVNNSFATIQAQIDAGYPIYIQPTFNYSDTITDISSKQCTVTSTTGLSTGFKVRISGLAVVAEEDLYNVASVDSGTTFTVTEAITDESSATAPVKAGSRWATDAIDYGIILSNLSITVNLTGVILDGDPVTHVRISVSEDDISYTEFAWNQNVVFVESFRYVKVDVDVDGDTGDDLYELRVFNIVISIKEKTEAGTVEISGTGGTLVTFTKTWIDINSIVLAAGVDGAGFEALIPIYDFADDPNPTTMEVRLYNSSGTEQSSGTVSWNVRGH